jgi:hypothetical protein
VAGKPQTAERWEGSHVRVPRWRQSHRSRGHTSSAPPVHAVKPQRLPGVWPPHPKPGDSDDCGHPSDMTLPGRASNDRDSESIKGRVIDRTSRRRSRCSYLARDHGRLRATRPSDPSTLVRPLLPMRGGYEADSYPDSGASALPGRFLTSNRGGATALPSGLVQVLPGSLGMRCPGSTGPMCLPSSPEAKTSPPVPFDISAAIYAPSIVITVHWKNRLKMACGSISEGSRFAAAELENLAVK